MTEPFATFKYKRNDFPEREVLITKIGKFHTSNGDLTYYEVDEYDMWEKNHFHNNHTFVKGEFDLAKA